MFSYELNRASADIAWGTIQVLGREPPERAFSHMMVLTSDELLLYGGLYTAVNDSGVGVKRVAFSDAWIYKYTPTRHPLLPPTTSASPARLRDGLGLHNR